MRARTHTRFRTPLGVALAGLAVAAALVLVPDGRAAAARYADATGDASGQGADVSGVTISSDDAGTVSIRIDTPNHPTLEQTENIQLLLDTDRDRSTGQNGFEYRIRVFGGDPTPIKLERADGADVAQGSFRGSFSAGVSVSVNRRDLGNTSGFEFALVTIDGTTGAVSDRVPDAALSERLSFALPAAPVSPQPQAPQPPAPQPPAPQPTAPQPPAPQPPAPQPAAPQPAASQPAAEQPATPELAAPQPTPDSPAAAPTAGSPADAIATATPATPAVPQASAPQAAVAPTAGLAPAVPPSSRSGSARLAVVDFATSARRPRAGREFAAGIQVQDDRTGALVTRAAITCTASVAGRALRVAWKGYTEDGFAACSVRTPLGSAGKRLRITITAKHGRLVARRVFSLRLA